MYWIPEAFVEPEYKTFDEVAEELRSDTPNLLLSGQAGDAVDSVGVTLENMDPREFAQRVLEQKDDCEGLGRWLVKMVEDDIKRYTSE